MKNNMTLAELKVFVPTINIGTPFKSFVYLTNELSYIIVIHTDSDGFIDSSLVSKIKITIINKVTRKFGVSADSIQFILLNPPEWPFVKNPQKKSNT